MSAFYRFVRGLFIFWFHLTRVHVYGAENIPDEGPVVLVANHNHGKDAALVAVACRKRQVHFVAKMELYRHPLKRCFFSWLDTISLNRDDVDLSTMHDVLGYLKSGQVIGIFPEGELNDRKSLREFKQGPALIAMKGNAVVVPIGVHHPENTFAFWRKRPYAIVGKPIVMPQGRATHELLEEYTNLFRVKILELLDTPKPQ